jgi:inward rectifier potassium channel
MGASRFDLRDPYHLAVSLSWPSFAIALLAVWLAVNLIFASLYVLEPGSVANAAPGSFSDAFFFSVETMATVGYGVMAPASTYGHIVSATEIVSGTVFTAIFTGLLFVRFSRPKAKIVYAEQAVVTTYNGRHSLMIRMANGRTTLMTNANARLFVLLAEHTDEGVLFRRIHELPLMQSHLPLFVMPWTLMHTIDESSPLHGYGDADMLAAASVRVFLTLEARDQAMAAVVHDMKYYEPTSVRFGMRYVDAVRIDETGQTIADLSRISLIEPDKGNDPEWTRWAR